MRALLFSAAFLLACAPQAPIQDVDLAISLEHSGDEVGLGEAFELSVVRIWSKDLEPPAFDDAVLAPLVVRLEGVSRREDARRIEETRRYRAYAFDRQSLAVPAVSFAAFPKSGGPARIASGSAFGLRVRPSLDAAAPGPVELPDDLPAPRPRWTRWLAAAAAIVVGGAAWLWRVHRRPAPESPGRPAPSPTERALLRIAALRERDPRSPEEIEAWYVEASAIVRDLLVDACSVRAREMTTEETVAAPAIVRRLPGDRPRLVADVLLPCDLVKFARRAPPASERSDLVSAMERLVAVVEPEPAAP